MKLRRSLLGNMITFIVVLAPVPLLFAQENIERMQAAYIYNFAKYIEWPESSDVFVIGVYAPADSSFTEVLRQNLKEKRVRGNEISVKEVSSTTEASECNIVYAGNEVSNRVAEIATALSGKAVLIVTEKNMIRKGAMISFVIHDQRLKFALKKDLLLNAGLLPSQGLLNLAILY